MKTVFEKKKVVNFLSLAIMMVANGWVPTANAKFLPENNLHLEFQSTKSNVDEAQFNQVMDLVEQKVGPYFKIHNAELVLVRKWDDPTVNAYADRNEGQWRVIIYGGIARREEVTPDGLALIVCHEVGHHLGGFPVYPNAEWASLEGQGDYYATQACLRELWRDDLELNEQSAEKVDAYAKKACKNNWKKSADRNLCYRVANASQSVANLAARLEGSANPKFCTPDPTQVGSNYSGHPHAQCRLDTYLQGAICTAEFDLRVIPGADMPNSEAAEKEAALNSCYNRRSKHYSGNRPRCWFKPGLPDFHH